MSRLIPSKFQHIVLAAALWAGCATAASPVDAQLARLYAEKRWAQALSVIEAELARSPGDVQRQLQKGVVLSNLNRQADALVVFRKLTVEHPELPGPYNNVAVLLASRGEFEEAREALERAIRTHPTYATAYENLGDLYSHMATDAYRKALRYDKQPATARPRLALVDGLRGGLALAENKADLATGGAAPAQPPGQASALATPTQAGASVVRTPLTTPQLTAPPVVAAVPVTSGPSAAGSVSVVKGPAALSPPAAPASVGPTTATSKATAVPVPVPTPPASATMAAVASASKVAAEAKPAAPAQPAKTASAALPTAPSAQVSQAATAPVASAKATAKNDADDDRALRQAVAEWSRAWSRRDLNAYFAAYAADFKGKAKSHAAWRAERQDRITGKKRIEVAVSEIAVKVQGKNAEVRFTQSYESDALRIVSPKVLSFERMGGKWLILQESAGK